MEYNFYEMLFSIVGFLLVLMLSIIGFFLKKQVEVTEKLELSTISLDKTVSLLQSNQHNFSKQCGFHHQTIDKILTDHNQRINSNTEKINEHGEILSELKGSIKKVNKTK
jgi:peptidoglycan hydrolase CwlO-like protein